VVVVLLGRIAVLSTTYVDAAYSYQPSIVVRRFVCLSVTLVSPAKTAAPIQIPFGLRTQVGPGNHVLDGGPDVLRDVAMATVFAAAMQCYRLSVNKNVCIHVLLAVPTTLFIKGARTLISTVR